MRPQVLDEVEQRKLMRWARLAIEEAVARKPRSPVPVAAISGALNSPHAAFVTLKKNGELRGCIGYLDFDKPLWENVVKAAVASALEDSRFSPVQADELAAIRLEISVLESPIDLPRLEDFDPQQHGIIVEQGRQHALLLPKVAQEWGWSAEQVLEATCEKAGLPKDAWRHPSTHLQIFTAFDFAEPPAP